MFRCVRKTIARLNLYIRRFFFRPIDGSKQTSWERKESLCEFKGEGDRLKHGLTDKHRK